MSTSARTIVLEASERAKAKLLQSFDDVEGACESPIERLFLAGLIATSVDDLSAMEIIIPGGATFRERYARDFPTVVVWLQRKVGPYRADFVLEWHNKDQRFALVVECDGHEFHDRTKEQARRDKARDRYLQLQGFHVARYTGSELHADAEKCASEALELLYSIGMR